MTRSRKPGPRWPCLLLAGALSQAPPVFELPLFGYLSIALLLIGAIALMPQLAAVVFRALQGAWLRTEASSHAPVRA
jgi:putative ABC transport system permease protein